MTENENHATAMMADGSAQHHGGSVYHAQEFTSSLHPPRRSSTTESESDELTSTWQLRLTITDSEASSFCEEEGGESGSSCVEATLEASRAPSDPFEPGDGGGDTMVAAAVVSPLKIDGGDVDRPPSETSPETSMAPLDGVVPEVSLDDGDNSVDDGHRQGSSGSARGMNQPRSPQQKKGNEASHSSSPLKENGAITASVATNDSSTPQKTNEPGTPRSQYSDLSKSSSLLDALLGQVESSISEEESSSIIQSDAGGSRCTSTTPMINLTFSGGDAPDEKLVALGAFAKAAKADGQAAAADDIITKDSEPSFYTAKDGSASESMDDHGIKTTISSGSGSPMTRPRRGRISPVSTVPEAGEPDASTSPRKAKSSIPISPSSAYSTGGGLDKKRLSERLRQRLAKRNQMYHAAASSSPTKSSEEDSPTSKPIRDKARDRSQWETRLQAASRQKRLSKSRAKSETSPDGANSDILSKYSGSSEVDGTVYPDTVTFSDGEEEPPALRVNTKIASRDRRTAYRKCVSEVGVTLSQSTRSARTKLSKHHHSQHHGIGILQADGIVYDDALLLRLARQARYGRLRGEVSNALANDIAGSSRGRYNDVKIHVYDLLTKDALVEMPYFNCNFPIGQCFKVVNDGCHVLGTGAYHVGVEVNGVEYAFGANNIIGMSGIFTCVPRESPGYEYRESLDFGKLHTTKRTWIRIPKSGTGTSFKTISAALGGTVDSDEKIVDQRGSPINSKNASSKDKHLYSYREIESFADGHAMIHSMAREYMGTDYDLLRKNCCTFARDVCMRLGTKEEDIPRWFHNAAQAGADAEDAITNVEYSVRNMLDCAEGIDPLDLECYNHGFEVILPNLEKEGKLTTGLQVVESPTMRTPRERRLLGDDDDLSLSEMHETASWTY